MNSKAKLRTFASLFYKASSWNRPRKVVCSLQPVTGETGMRQEADIRYVVPSLEGTAQHLFQDVYRQRGQMENLHIKMKPYKTNGKAERFIQTALREWACGPR
jgi:hypothetical protein